ncbi:hypothetical protein ACRC7T_17655 [Segnochrobactraceae bacterium EtOH-i3]
MIDASRYPLDDVALEQKDAKVFSSSFTRALTLDWTTPARWRRGGSADGDGERLDERSHGDA